MARKNYANTTPEMRPNEMGKLPPQAVDIEEVVLGALMLEREAYNRIAEILKYSEAFYKVEHQKIYEAIRDLATENHPVDMLTVTDQLKKNGALEEVGGPLYIGHLTTRVASAASIEYHAKLIAQKFLQRELIRVSSQTLSAAYDDSIDVEELLGKAEEDVFALSQRKSTRDYTQIDPVITESINQIREAAKIVDGFSGLASGFDALDKITSGWQRSDLVVIAARPAMGKTAFALTMAHRMAMNGIGVAVFSLEMANVQLVNRLIVSETEISGHQIKNGKLSDAEWQKLDFKIKNLQGIPLYVDDTPALSIFELRAKARRLVSQEKVQILMIDYLQLMTAAGMNSGSRQEEVSLISRSLKALARELNVPILALSQLNRGNEGRTGLEGKRPQLSDLRESGAIEQDADMVMFVHRPEYYKQYEDAQGNSLMGIAEIIIAKHRNGEIGDVRLRFRAELARFENIHVHTRKEVIFKSKVNGQSTPNSNEDVSNELPTGDLGAEDYEQPLGIDGSINENDPLYG